MTFNHRSSERLTRLPEAGTDVDGLLDLRHLRDDIDPAVPDATLAEFSALARLEAGAALPPTLIAKVARDEVFGTHLNASIGRFVATAQARDAPIEFHTHETGHPGFDIFDDDDRSRAIIRRTLAFMRGNLFG